MKSNSASSGFLGAHGGGTAYWQDSVFWVEPSGAFNMQGMVELEAKMRQLIQSVSLKRWARVEVYKDKDTFAPATEAAPILMEHMNFNVASGCQCMVIIGGNILVKEAVAALGKQIGLAVHLFQHEEEARIWLMQQGYLSEC